MILGPKIDHGRGQLELISNDPFQDPKTRNNYPLTEDGIVSINERMSEWDRILTFYKHDIIRSDVKLDHPRSNLDTDRWTRKIIFDLFPEIKTVVDSGKENEFFKGQSLQGYINEVAFKNALSFRSWLINNLPVESKTIIPTYGDIFIRKKKIPTTPEDFILKYHKLLSLSKRFRKISNLPDLVKYYPGQINQVKPQDQRFTHEVMTLLSALYVTTILDLSKTSEENVLPDFVEDLEDAFPYKDPPDIIYLLIGLSKDGKCQRMSVQPMKWQAKLYIQIGKYDASDIHYIRNIEVEIDTETGELWEDLTWEEKIAGRKKKIKFFTIHDDREKTLESETCKAYRDRAMPPSDRRGARIIINDRDHLDFYIKLLSKKMPGWYIFEDEVKSRSRQQTIEHNIQYFASRNENPKHRIELNIEWLWKGHMGFGSWVQKRYESFAGRNAYAYKMRELIEEIYPKWFPEEIYGIRWSMDGVKNDLIGHANRKALGQEA